MTGAQQTSLLLGRCDEVRWGRREGLAAGVRKRKSGKVGAGGKRDCLVTETYFSCLRSKRSRAWERTFRLFRDFKLLQAVQRSKNRGAENNTGGEKSQTGGEIKQPNPCVLLPSTLLLLSRSPASLSPLGWLCVVPWGFHWAWASLARAVRLALKRLGCSWARTRERAGKEGESGRRVRERERDREVVGTIVGGFNHSDAICSTPFFALTVDIFPGETRGVCVRVYMTMRDSEGQTSISTEHNIFIFYTLYNSTV